MQLSLKGDLNRDVHSLVVFEVTGRLAPNSISPWLVSPHPEVDQSPSTSVWRLTGQGLINLEAKQPIIANTMSEWTSLLNINTFPNRLQIFLSEARFSESLSQLENLISKCTLISYCHGVILYTSRTGTSLGPLNGSLGMTLIYFFSSNGSCCPKHQWYGGARSLRNFTNPSTSAYNVLSLPIPT